MIRLVNTPDLKYMQPFYPAMIAVLILVILSLLFYTSRSLKRYQKILSDLKISETRFRSVIDTAGTGIAEYSGDIIQEDAATYDASYNTNEDVAANERDVYNYLTGTMGMNSAAASGVMASMYRESRFYVDITNDYGTAYGLCQWYGDRWTNLQNYCNNNGLDWHTLYGQMRFLEYELNSLSSLRSYMYGISNDANGAYHAGYEWCRVYELGGNTSDTTRCDSRGTLARDTFWPKYQNGSTGGYTGWRSENGRDYWYENGVKQGTTGRGKEIYDASSDAWYWLDAVDGGAKAVNKDVYQESDGGKWVRYDENGHMIKGENCQNGNWYYFEPVTGAMIHGPWTLPDGRKVYYDLTTGIMQYGYRIVEDMASGLSHYLADQGFDSLQEMVGLANNNIVPAEDLDRSYIVYPRINLDKCVGCGRCYISCYDGGHQAMEWSEKTRTPHCNTEKCVGCLLCGHVCPVGCIELGEVKFKKGEKEHPVTL